MDLEKAINNVEKMANGINPLTNEYLPQNSLLNNIEISRSLFCLLDVVKNPNKRKNFKANFSITRAELDKYAYSEDLSLTEFAKYINSLKIANDTKELKYSDLAKWLINIGMLIEVEEFNKKRKIPTEDGKNIGMYTTVRNGYYGSYEIVLYNKEAQNFIIDNFEDFLLFNNKKI